MLKIYLKDLFLRYASGQSYKHFTLVNYDSKVVADWKTYYNPRVVIYEHKMFIRLATGRLGAIVDVELALLPLGGPLSFRLK